MYYLWINEAQAGPFTLGQIQSMWSAGQITPLTLYFEPGNADWLPLNNIVSLIESGARPVTNLTPPPGPLFASRMETGAGQRATVVGPPLPVADVPEKVAWTGHPTLWHWFESICWGLILSPIVIGIFILVYVFARRASTTYRVTNRTISVETGILSHNTRELRIQDIRSIAANANLFGVGNVEFSTAARDDAEIVFRGITKAAKIRDLVKQLQNGVR